MTNYKEKYFKDNFKKYKNLTKTTHFSDNILFRSIVLFFSLSCSFIILVGTNNSQDNSQLFLFPLFYGLLFFLCSSMWNFIYGNIGLTFLNIVLFIRYVISPIFWSFNYNYGDLRGIPASEEGVKLGIFIMITEMFASFFTIQYFAPYFYRKREDNNNFQPFHSKLILYFFLIFGIFIWILFPEINDRYNFFIIRNRINKIYFNSSFNGLVYLISDLVLVIFPIVLLDIFKKFYDKRQSIIFVFLSILSILPTITIFKGTSRFSVLIPTVAFMIILLKLYKKHSNIIRIIITSILLIVFLNVSLYKQFGITYGSKSINLSLNSDEIANTLDSYFSGPNNMGHVVDMSRTPGIINNTTLRNDLINNIAIISRYSDVTNTTSYKFNIFFYGIKKSFDQIVPLSGQSYLHFGFLGAPFFLIITLIIMMKFDSKIKYESRIEYIYIFVYLTLYSSMAMMVSFASIYPIFTNLMLPYVLIFYFNRKLKFFLKTKD